MKRLVHIIHRRFAVLSFPRAGVIGGNKSGNVRTKWHDEAATLTHQLARSLTHFWWGKTTKRDGLGSDSRVFSSWQCNTCSQCTNSLRSLTSRAVAKSVAAIGPARKMWIASCDCFCAYILLSISVQRLSARIFDLGANAPRRWRSSARCRQLDDATRCCLRNGNMANIKVAVRVRPISAR